MTLQQCKDACTQTDDCHNFGHCPRDQNKCWLRDRILTGNEPTKYKHYCSTYYSKTGILSSYKKSAYILLGHFDGIKFLTNFNIFRCNDNSNYRKNYHDSKNDSDDKG